MNNKELADKIIKYWGCKMWDNSMLTVCTFEGIRVDAHDVYVRTRTKQGTPNEVSVDKVKPLLTPLPQISDEDAIEVAKIAYPDIKQWHSVTVGKNIVLHNLFIGYHNGVNIFEGNKILDYLRSSVRPDGREKVAYDIDNGINEGWAIDAAKLAK